MGFNLAIFVSKIRQIAKFKHPPNFPVIYIYMYGIKPILSGCQISTLSVRHVTSVGVTIVI